jgi:hypothetical protein
LRPNLPVARDFHMQRFRQGVDDADADTVQAAGGLVYIVAELTARVQSGKDDFQCRFVLVLRMGIDRDAAPVIGDRQRSVVG